MPFVQFFVILPLAFNIWNTYRNIVGTFWMTSYILGIRQLNSLFRLINQTIGNPFKVKLHYLLLLTLLSTNAVALEQEKKQQVNIAPNSLAEALIEFSLQFKRIIIGRPSILEGHHTAKVEGEYTAEETLELLLKNSGLEFFPNSSTGFIVKKTEKLPANTAQPTQQEQTNAEQMLILAPPANLRATLVSTSDSSLDTEFIADNNITTLRTLSTKTPNLSVTSDTLGFLNINIRGVLNYGNTFQSSQAIPLHYNGHFISATQSIGLILHDLEAIDVFRGPQSTHWGRSAVGGSIYVQSTTPKLNETEAKINLSTGNYDLKNLEAALNIPVGDELAFRIAGMRETRDGYINTWDSYERVERNNGTPFDYAAEHPASAYTSTYDGPNFDNSDKTALRISGIWEPTERTQIVAHWETQKDDSLPSVAIDPYLVKHYERATVADSPVIQRSKRDLYGITINQDFSFFDVNYKLRRSVSEYKNILDLDLGLRDHAIEKSEYRRQSPREEQLSHNLEFNGSSGPLKWLAGIYREDFDLAKQLIIADYSYGVDGQAFSMGIMTFEPDVESSYQDTYGHIEYQILPNWSLDAGARYIDNERLIGEQLMYFCFGNNFFGVHPITFNAHRPEANLENTTPSALADYIERTPDAFDGLNCFPSLNEGDKKREHALTYQIGSTLDINNNLSAQLKYSTGFRPGDLIQSNDLPDHKSRNLELGFIGSAMNDKLNFTTTMFYSEHEDVILDYAADGFNATIYGLELTLSHEDSFGGLLELSGAYLHTSIDELDLVWNGEILSGADWNPPSSDPELAAQGYYDFSDNELPNSPEYSISLSYEYPIFSSVGTWTPRIRLAAVADYYFDVHNSEDYTYTDDQGREIVFNDMSRQPSYTTVDLSFGWESPSNKYRADLSVYNATDEQIRTSTKDDFFSNEGYSSTYAAPRLIVFKVSYLYH